MYKRRAGIAAIIATGLFALPFIAAAQGLVPCSGIDCQACNVVDLLNNIISFLIGLSIPIAMALFAYAGILYFTSAANPGNVGKAKKIFGKVFFGIVIALVSYVVVETVLHTILSQEYWESWNQIQCVSPESRNTSANIGDLLGQALTVFGTGPTGVQVGGTSGTPSCPSGYQWVQEMGTCFNPSNSSTVAPTYTVTPGTRGTTVCSINNTACSPGVLLASGLTTAQANAMSCIAVTESSGNPSIGCSNTKTPCGLYQINNGNWDAYAPSDCRDYSYKHNGDCNRRTAIVMMNQVGYQPWTGNLNGVAWNPAASTCVNTFDPGTTLRR